MDIKHLTNKQVKHLKHVYQTAPYKGEPYIKYIRYTKKQTYVKFLKKECHHFKHGELGGIKLGNAYDDFIAKLNEHFSFFYHDDAGYLYHFDAYNYFDELATGQTLADSLNSYISNSHLNTTNMVSLLTTARAISNFQYLYKFKRDNWSGEIISIKRANVNDVLKAIKLAIHNITNPNYRSKITRITKIINILSNLQIDVQVETSFLMYGGKIPHNLYWFDDMKKHIGYLKYSNNKTFNRNIIKYYYILQNIFNKHLKKLSKQTIAQIKALNKPLFYQSCKVKKQLIEDMKTEK